MPPTPSPLRGIPFSFVSSYVCWGSVREPDKGGEASKRNSMLGIFLTAFRGVVVLVGSQKRTALASEGKDP